jgi:hypothetical protein
VGRFPDDLNYPLACSNLSAHFLPFELRTVDLHRRGGVYGAHCSGLSLLSSRRVTGCRHLQSYIGCTHGLDRSFFSEGQEDLDEAPLFHNQFFLKIHEDWGEVLEKSMSNPAGGPRL